MADRVKMRLKKGDQVLVLTGKDVGKQGEITRVLPDRNMVIVDGINVAKNWLDVCVRPVANPTQAPGKRAKTDPTSAYCFLRP